MPEMILPGNESLLEDLRREFGGVSSQPEQSPTESILQDQDLMSELFVEFDPRAKILNAAVEEGFYSGRDLQSPEKAWEWAEAGMRRADPNYSRISEIDEQISRIDEEKPWEILTNPDERKESRKNHREKVENLLAERSRLQRDNKVPIDKVRKTFLDTYKKGYAEGKSIEDMKESYRNVLFDNAWLRDAGVAAVDVGSSFASVANRVPSMILGTDVADDFNRFRGRYSDMAAMVDEEQGQNGAEKFLHKTIRGAGSSLLKSFLLGPTGRTGIALGFGVDAANQELTSAGDMGMEGADLYIHSAVIGAIEAGVTIAFSKLGRGGFEDIMAGGQKAASGVKDLIWQTAGRHIPNELVEELSVEAASEIKRQISGVGGDLTFEKGRDMVADIVAQTVMSAGMGQVKQVNASIEQGRFDDFLSNPTRRAAKSRQIQELAKTMGFDLRKASDRKDMAKVIAEKKTKAILAEQVNDEDSDLSKFIQNPSVKNANNDTMATISRGLEVDLRKPKDRETLRDFLEQASVAQEAAQEAPESTSIENPPQGTTPAVEGPPKVPPRLSKGQKRAL